MIDVEEFCGVHLAFMSVTGGRTSGYAGRTSDTQPYTAYFQQYSTVSVSQVSPKVGSESFFRPAWQMNLIEKPRVLQTMGSHILLACLVDGLECSRFCQDGAAAEGSDNMKS